eukprot:m.63001 g.63001  ORF g.63001 m.63001 type:complete len:214 (-) comp49609_c0_seq2:100-741(-)
MELVAQGAEARIYLHELFGRPCLVKERFSKSYRHPVVNEKLTTSRTQHEVKALLRCRELGIPTPAVYLVDLSRNMIFMEYFATAITVKEQIITVGDELAPHVALMNSIGSLIATLHSNNLIHGDLTTSNFLLEPSTNVVYVIDFGLCATSTLIEDKAVDLYVLERAFKSTHPNADELFAQIMTAYSASVRQSDAIIRKLGEVRERGRKRSMLG